MRGVLPQLQSGAQLLVDRRRLLSSSFNISVVDGRLALLLSVSPPTHNDTGADSGLNASLSAQFKGRVITKRLTLLECETNLGF